MNSSPLNNNYVPHSLNIALPKNNNQPFFKLSPATQKLLQESQEATIKLNQTIQSVSQTNNKILTALPKNNLPITADNFHKTHTQTITKISNQNKKMPWEWAPINSQSAVISKAQPTSQTAIMQTIVMPSFDFQNKFGKEVISNDTEIKSSEQEIAQVPEESYKNKCTPYKKRKINFEGNAEIIGTHQLTEVTKAKENIVDCSVTSSHPTEIKQIVKPLKEIPTKATAKKEEPKKVTPKKGISKNDNKTLENNSKKPTVLEKYDVSTKKKFKLIKREGFPNLAVFKKIISSKLVKFRDSEKNSLLHIAAAASDKKNSLKYAEVIATKKFDIDAINNIGNTALHIAEEKKNWTFANYLKTLGANRNIINDAGLTADMINKPMLNHAPSNLSITMKENKAELKPIQLDLTNSDEEFTPPLLVKREEGDSSIEEMDVIPAKREIIEISEDDEIDQILNDTFETTEYSIKQEIKKENS